MLIKGKVQERGADWKKYPKDDATTTTTKEWELKEVRLSKCWRIRTNR